MWEKLQGLKNLLPFVGTAAGFLGFGKVQGIITGVVATVVFLAGINIGQKLGFREGYREGEKACEREDGEGRRRIWPFRDDIENEEPEIVGQAMPIQ